MASFSYAALALALGRTPRPIDLNSAGARPVALGLRAPPTAIRQRRLAASTPQGRNKVNASAPCSTLECGLGFEPVPSLKVETRLRKGSPLIAPFLREKKKMLTPDCTAPKFIDEATLLCKVPLVPPLTFDLVEPVPSLKVETRLRKGCP